MSFQCTLNKSIQLTGIGLHSGRPVNLHLKPAPEDSGILFQRRDLPGRPIIPAHVSNVIGTTLCTTLGFNGVVVRTVEHLMAALYGLRIDNVIVELDSDELPIMDGSAEPFVRALRGAGLCLQGALRRYIRINHPICLAEADKLQCYCPLRDLLCLTPSFSIIL